MPPESLEEIKLLSNLETAQHKLLQIVLFGQPELDALLALPKLRQVRDRVVHRFELQPLNGPDAAAYIEHRLRRAGWQGGALFEPRALRHFLSCVRPLEVDGGTIRAEANFAILECLSDRDPIVNMVGRYVDTLVETDEGFLIEDRWCVYDNYRIRTSLIVPV